MKQEQHGNAYAAVKLVYDKSPGQSWRRLNSALQDTLTAAITAHLSFLPDDFAAIRRDMKGSYWMGNDGNKVVGERYYTLAVKVGHTPACISFEKHAGRPAILWAESTKTPERLVDGSEFTWNRERLTVTSILQDRLVACTYHGNKYPGHDTLKIGGLEHLNDGTYRPIEAIRQLKTYVQVTFGEPVVDPYNRKPKSLVKILIAELNAKRKEYDANRRLALKDIAGAETIEALDAVSRRLSSIGRDGYRHFDIEDFSAAIRERQKQFGVDLESQRHARAEAEALEKWVNGGPGRLFYTVKLRVNGDYVETSTGQRATVKSVRQALPVVLRRRTAFGPVANLAVDSFAVEEQTTAGVKVGCTWIPWPEVERLEKILKGISA